MISQRITQARMKKGISMRQAAIDMGFPYTTYVNYEKGVSEPNSEALARIAVYYDISADYLVGVDEKKKDLEWDIEAEKFSQESENNQKLLFQYLNKYFSVQDVSIVFDLIQELPKLNKNGLLEMRKRLDELTRLEEYESDTRKDLK